MAEALIGMIERLWREVLDLDALLAEEAIESSFIQARQKIAAALAGRRSA